MAKITFMGAGSTVFVRNIVGDCMLSPVLRDSHFALYDIDGRRLKESKLVAEALNAGVNSGRATISAHLGVANRQEALAGADYVINAIQVGGYEPSTVIDFEVPKKYGLRQTIGDTIGIGGIFRGLRTIPVMLDFAADMEAVCPNAWMLNYTNPMAIVTGAVLLGSRAKTVGLCHSVQVCAAHLLHRLGMLDGVGNLQWKIAGINHQAWLLEVRDGDKDLYPQVRQRAGEKNRQARLTGAPKHGDMVRMEVLRHFGYYVTESSEHTSEYMPYWINSRHPELVGEFNIPLDEYPRRCVDQIQRWNKQRDELLKSTRLGHEHSDEYAADIMQAMETGSAASIGGNVLNTGLITNLPAKAVVEVPCLVDANGVQGCYVGELPEQLAALNRTNINVQLLTVQAALEHNREAIYHAAMLDPHTAAELTLDQIRGLCDDLIEAHGDMLPKYQ